MTTRKNIVSQLGAYFASKGGAMTMEEYKNAEDAPIRFVLIKRTIGSWGRLLNMIGDVSNYSIEVDIVKEPDPVEAPKQEKPKAEPVVQKTKGA
jgi:hypothetical protein